MKFVLVLVKCTHSLVNLTLKNIARKFTKTNLIFKNFPLGGLTTTPDNWCRVSALFVYKIFLEFVRLFVSLKPKIDPNLSSFIIIFEGLVPIFVQKFVGRNHSL